MLRGSPVAYAAPRWACDGTATVMCSTSTITRHGHDEQHADSDGCVVLNVAGQLLRQQAPEDYAETDKRYGFKSLAKLILGVGLFVKKPTHANLVPAVSADVKMTLAPK